MDRAARSNRQVATLTRRAALLATAAAAIAAGTGYLPAAAETLDRTLISVEEGLFQMRVTGSGQDQIRYPSRLMERLTYLFNTVAVADFRPTDQQGEVHVVLKERLRLIAAALQEVLDDDVEDFNRMLQTLGLRVIS